MGVLRRGGSGDRVLLLVVWFGSSGLGMVVGCLGWGLDRPRELVVVETLKRGGSSGLARGLLLWLSSCAVSSMVILNSSEAGPVAPTRRTGWVLERGVAVLWW